MFETSVVTARVAERRYSLLYVSVVAHSLVVIAVIAASLSSTSFPKAPPHEYQVFFHGATPPLPPAAPRNATPQPAQAHPATTVVSSLPHAPAVPAQVTPSHIPDAIPTVPASSGDATSLSTATTTGGGGSDIGDPNGVDIGQPATNSTPSPDTIFHPGAEVKPAVVLYRVEPQYPRAALAARVSGVVVLKCVIDRNGNVRDAEVVTSSFSAFNQPALDALQHWRFAPGAFRGKAVDTWFELTIRFQPR